MDNYDYIDIIVTTLRGKTALNFQSSMKDVFHEYYKSLGKDYKMPDCYGGDDKNDGWVAEDALFYQIFAPTRKNKSLKKDIQKKFTEDLDGLLHKICNEKKWKGRINEFIFLVNTFDSDLPHDSEDFFAQKVKWFKEKYSIEFGYKVVNLDYVRDILCEISDIEVLKGISSRLRIKNLINCEEINEQIIMELILEISENIGLNYLNDSEQSYQRVSTIKKIKINSLEKKREEIENIISKLDVVEGGVSKFNQDVSFVNKFDRVKMAIIKKYKELSETLSGVDLYESLICDTLFLTKDKYRFNVSMKFLIVYIFDKCDIFEKEQVMKNDIT